MTTTEETTMDERDEKKLHVFGDDCEWVIAYDLDDARKVYEEHVGGPVSEDACDGWEQETDSANTTCRCGDDGRPIAIEDGGADETLTNAEWAARLGRGYFCTTEA